MAVNMTVYIYFPIFAQNINCGFTLEPPQWVGSNEYSQSMFKSKNKENEYPCKPQILLYKMGVRGSTLHRHVSMMFLTTVIKSTCF